MNRRRSANAASSSRHAPATLSKAAIGDVSSMTAGDSPRRVSPSAGSAARRYRCAGSSGYGFGICCGGVSLTSSSSGCVLHSCCRTPSFLSERGTKIPARPALTGRAFRLSMVRHHASVRRTRHAIDSFCADERLVAEHRPRWRCQPPSQHCIPGSGRHLQHELRKTANVRNKVSARILKISFFVPASGV